ncbi:MAG: ctpA, partial [Chloroflexi bacterium]|nr:ctpA [Chloroflexota bacterium]
EDVTGIDPELVLQKVKGPKGTEVILTVHREGVEQPFDVEIERASIVVPTIESKMLDDKIAYIHLYSFGDKTSEDLRKALKTLLAKKPAGLILDLRYNSGGYLNTSIEVASEFISDGVIVYEEYGDGQREVFRAQKGGLATKIPMVVLVNEGSASASEIVAGAIQDYGRGELVGVTTYGKGSVQSVVSLIDDQGQVRVTVARWLTPKERQINKIGLEPDHTVEITQEDFEAGRDPQLDKAIELLLKK